MIAHLNNRAICFAAQMTAIVLLMAVSYASSQIVTADNATLSSDSIPYPELLPLFWLGSEVDTDSDSGDSYLSSEYLNMDEDISIRIGENSEGNLRVYFHRWSDDAKEVIESPMLRRE